MKTCLCSNNLQECNNTCKWEMVDASYLYDTVEICTCGYQMDDGECMFKGTKYYEALHKQEPEVQTKNYEDVI